MSDTFWQYWTTDSDPLDLSDPRGPVLSGETIDQVAIDSLKWHYNDTSPMDTELRQAFQRVLKYYGVTVG